MTVQKELIAKREKEKAKRLELLREELEALEAWDCAFTPSPMPRRSLDAKQAQAIANAYLELASLSVFLSSDGLDERREMYSKGWEQLCKEARRQADALTEQFPEALPIIEAMPV